LYDFRDIASSWSITRLNVSGGVNDKQLILETTGNGTAIFDFDNDGDEDLLLLSARRLQGNDASATTLYRNNGSGNFAAVDNAAGLALAGWAQAACVADVNNDGWMDVFITYFGSNRLFLNSTRGSFTDATAKSGMPTSGQRYGSGCSFLDYNRDGRLDLFVANYVNLVPEKTPKPGSSSECQWKEIAVMCGPRGLPKAQNVLYRQEADGSFRDVSKEAGMLTAEGRYALQAVSADFDNDGWPDIYVACDMTPSLLYQNKAGRGFVERGEEAGVAYNFDGRLQAGMGVAVADFNRDGRLDIAKTNFSGDLPSLYRNDDGRYFTDISREAGLAVHQYLGWGATLTDFDDDGWPDLMLANGHVYPEVDQHPVGDRYRQPTLLYRNEAGRRFRDVSSSSGIAMKELRPARGLAAGDLDGDGRPEVVLLNMNEAPSVLKNHAAGGNWINLRLKGTKSNRAAIGARWTVRATGVSQPWTGEVQSGGSFYSQHSLTQHIGLGEAKQVDVSVRWPCGITTQHAGLKSMQLHVLTEPATGR
jgi:enediyne biosynthesis protein E4